MDGECAGALGCAALDGDGLAVDKCFGVLHACAVGVDEAVVVGVDAIVGEVGGDGDDGTCDVGVGDFVVVVA